MPNRPRLANLHGLRGFAGSAAVRSEPACDLAGPTQLVDYARCERITCREFRIPIAERHANAAGCARQADLNPRHFVIEADGVRPRAGDH